MSALDNFRTALEAAVDRYRAMGDEAFMEAVMGIIGDRTDLPGWTQLPDALIAVARLGSIEAAAALIVMRDDDEALNERCVEALKGIVERSADLTTDCQVDALTDMMEEWCMEELAAGRMTFTIDTKTGQKLWSTVKSGSAPP